MAERTIPGVKKPRVFMMAVDEGSGSIAVEFEAPSRGPVLPAFLPSPSDTVHAPPRSRPASADRDAFLFRKLYEDNALGRLSNEQFVFLTSGYEDEKRELTKRAAELKREIDTAAERNADVKRFVALVRRYTEISELTYENVHEFIDRILIYEL